MGQHNYKNDCRVSALFCLLFTFAACKSTTTNTPVIVNNGHWVTGYYVGYAPTRDLCRPEEIDWTGLTHFVMCRLKANSDGSLDFDFDWDTINGPALARNLNQRAHTAGKKTLLMLGGEGQGWQIYSAAANHRAVLVNNLLQALSDYGYDGIDLDWEENMDLDVLLALATDLRSALPKIILTFPLGMINPNYQSVEPRIATIAAQFDQLNLMSYYPATCMAGSGWLSWHNCPLKGWKSATPITIEDSLARYAASGIPKAKLGMGIAFYAIGYSGGITAPNQSTESAAVAIQGGDNDLPLAEFYQAGGIFNSAYRQWDAAALEPYLSLPAPDSRFGCRYFSYEDETSIAEKGSFAKASGYGGIIIWNINQGYIRGSANPNMLLQALKRAFID